MIDNKKEQERDELHRTIWNMANDLRGSVDGWDFKQYVLGMLFYRYISENFVRYVNAGEAEAGNANLIMPVFLTAVQSLQEKNWLIQRAILSCRANCSAM